jgi:hypothetical protein
MTPLILSILLLFFGQIYSGNPDAPAAPGQRTERYHYNAVKKGDDSGERETSRSVIRTTPDGFHYEFLSVDPKQTERGWIRTGPDAFFLGAYRTVERVDGRIAEVDSMWREDDRLRVLRRKPLEGKEELKDFDLPGDKPLAVDASLLLWMRGFPFADGAKRKVHMVDFSHHKVNVTVEQRGVETVAVPAGTFECYHLEVVVKVILLKARIHFWITTDEPHFLVRHEGKRGPFTATYITELVDYGATTEK